jgi:hypothetical protein
METKISITFGDGSERLLVSNPSLLFELDPQINNRPSLDIQAVKS